MKAFRGLAAVAAVAAAGVVAAACGGQAAPRAPGGTAGTAGYAAVASTAVAGTAGRTAAGNQKLAGQEAARLLGLVPLPGGSTRLRSVPGFASVAFMPAVTSLVDQVRAWRLDLPFGQAAAWLRAHRPGGLPAAGYSSGTSGSPPTTFAEDTYAGPSSLAWQSAQLEVEVVAAPGGTTVLRADGVVIWLDPVPVRDTPGSPRMRVTVAGGCPGSDRRFALGTRPTAHGARVTHQGVTNPGAGGAGADLKRRLLPAAAPHGGLECRYYGLNGPAFRLRSTTRLDAAQARRVAATMTAMPLSHVDGGVVSCPLDDESAEIIALSYPGRADVDLWVKLNGCTYVSNGYLQTGGI